MISTSPGFLDETKLTKMTKFKTDKCKNIRESIIRGNCKQNKSITYRQHSGNIKFVVQNCSYLAANDSKTGTFAFCRLSQK